MGAQCRQGFPKSPAGPDAKLQLLDGGDMVGVGQVGSGFLPAGKHSAGPNEAQPSPSTNPTLMVYIPIPPQLGIFMLNFFFGSTGI